MKVILCIFLGLVTLAECSHLPDACKPMVPGCPEETEIMPDCPTCCCSSSNNVEFYDPSSAADQECTAPPAIYDITFTYTRSEACYPDFYLEGAGWSRPSAFSHNSGFRLWDACMDGVRPGVAAFSQTGDTTAITGEGVLAAVVDMTTLDAPIFDGTPIGNGSGTESIYLTVDSDHQYVSTLTMLAPSADQVVGVADLRLCDGDKWKESVKVCYELFSTATVSGRVAPEMERNSVQGNNCSFGYVEFNLMKTETFERRRTIDDTCYPQVPEECFSADPIEACPTCCCKSSENVEFYNPDNREPECTADPAVYQMSFNFAWSEVCHPGNFESYSVFQPVWSWPVGVSHNTQYRMWDACMDNVSVGVGLVSQIGLTSVLVQEFAAAGDNILNYTIAGSLSQPTSVSSQNVTVDKDHQWVSAISNRGPTPDQLVGVADLRLCDGKEWKKTVKVCFELFSTGAASERVTPEMQRNSVQRDSCSFGYIEFNLVEVGKESPTESGAATVIVNISVLMLTALLLFFV